jgi:hypothetical protein
MKQLALVMQLVQFVQLVQSEHQSQARNVAAHSDSLPPRSASKVAVDRSNYISLHHCYLGNSNRGRKQFQSSAAASTTRPLTILPATNYGTQAQKIRGRCPLMHFTTHTLYMQCRAK